MTARDLLAHVAGIRHYQGNEALSGVHYGSVTDALRVFARDPLLFEPGTQYAYSSYGFNLVGAAIETISEEEFGDAVRRLVLAPLGMKQTAIDDGRRHQGWAAPYEVTEARKAIAAPSVDLSNRLPAGGFRSTAEDLARFGSRLGDARSSASRRKTPSSREQHLADGSGTSYGLGFEVGEAPFGRVVGHTGNVVGGTAFLLAQPRAGVAIAMATNIGYVTARTAPDLSAVPDPPALFTPFVSARAAAALMRYANSERTRSGPASVGSVRRRSRTAAAVPKWRSTPSDPANATLPSLWSVTVISSTLETVG